MILVRHGETALNAESRYQGRIDPPLSARGLEQAARLRTLFTRGFDEPSASMAPRPSSWEVHVSPALRCRQTAAAALPHVHASIDARVAELDFGAFDGRTYEENLAAHGDVFRAWLSDPWGVRPPDGETLAEMRARVHAWLDSLERNVNVIAITHGGPIRVVLARLLRIPFADTWEIEVSPGDALSVPLDDDLVAVSAQDLASLPIERLR
jgi:broad specificity phosphatase PhoE